MFNLTSVYMKINIKKDDLQKYIEDNKSLEEIATIYSCSKDTIKNRLKEFNIEYKSRSEYAEELRNKVSTMYQSGMTCLAIGNELIDLLDGFVNSGAKDEIIKSLKNDFKRS